MHEAWIQNTDPNVTEANQPGFNTLDPTSNIQGALWGDPNTGVTQATNPIDATGWCDLEIRFDRFANIISVGAYWILEVSYDGGISWTPILSGVQDFGWTFSGILSLGPQADNNSQLMIRFSIYSSDPNDVLWLDNIFIHACPCSATATPTATDTPMGTPTPTPTPTDTPFGTPTPTPTPFCQDFWWEDFEDFDDWGPGIMHNAWIQNTDPNVIEALQPGFNTLDPMSQVQGALVGDPMLGFTEAINPIDSTGWCALEIRFHRFAQFMSGGASWLLEVSYDGGMTWNPIVGGGPDPGWIPTGPLPLGPGADNNPMLMIRFSIYSSDPNDVLWLDNIFIHACPCGPTPTPTATDTPTQVPTDTPTPTSTPTPVPPPVITNIDRDKTTNPISNWVDITFTSVAGIWYDVEWTSDLIAPS